MNPKTPLFTLLSMIGSALLGISSASAQSSYYWDGNNTAAGFGTAGGTWAQPTTGTLTSGWSTSNNGTAVVNDTEIFTYTGDGLNFGYGATGLLSGTISVSGTVESGDMTFAAGSGAITLSGGTMYLASNTKITANNNTNTISSLIEGAFDSLTKAGSGTLILTNTNSTYAGVTKVTDGTLVINSIANIDEVSSLGWPYTGEIILGDGNNTGTLAYIGDGDESDRTIQINTFTNNYSGGAAILNHGTGALTFTANTFNLAYTNTSITHTRTLTLGGTNDGTISGKIVDNSAYSLVGITKTGSGTWTLAGDNENTGATTISGGGNLVLDYSTGNTGSKLPDTAALILSGGTLTLKGGSGLTETVNTSISNGATFITRDGGNTVLQMNNISRQNGGSVSFLDGTVAKTTTANNSFGMFGAWATIGDNFASNDGSGNIVAFSGSTSPLPTSGVGGSNTNYTLTGGQNQTGTSTLVASTLKISGTGGTDNTLALGGTNLRIQNNADSLAGGILYIGGGTGVYNITADATKGIGISNGSRDLIINTVRDTLQISARLDASWDTSSVLKAGAGTLVLSSTESVYTGVVYVNEGTLRLASNAAAGTTAGGIRVQYGAALELSNNITVGAEALTLDGNGLSNAGALRNKAGSNTYGGLVTIGASGARINSDASTSLTLTGGITTNLFRDATFGGAGDTTVSTAAISGTGALIKDGAGTLTLAASNTYTGATFVSAGTLKITGGTQATTAITVASEASLALDTASPVTAANAVIDLSNATILVTGSTGAEDYTLLSAASITGTPTLAQPVAGYTLEVSDGTTLRLVTSTGPGPVASFQISGIPAQAVVGTPITGITITAKDAANETATGFTGTVTFGGTAGATGTSAAFTAGVLSGVSITPNTSGSGLTFTVNNGSGQTGSTLLDVMSRFQDWASQSGLSGDSAALNADPDGDGLTNLQEFAFGLHPSNPALRPIGYTPGNNTFTPGLPALYHFGASGWHAVFTRRKDHVTADITYEVKFSADLKQWTTSNVGIDVEADGGTGSEHEAVSVPFPSSVPLYGAGAGSAPPKFFRVKVTQN